ncbi:hypothetical protein [Streptomyces sp. ALI-76-A]|uniref:hypothetical protein n=1 Tax=Streptomyces sp. ALI-76-A TaxID=3025736 RepID=UPI00256F5B92|nr:hypothetical protein [Streptomyces sp. ALI-76-A]MDL5200034.1 hypothetical protein [Streptomyces sp. ALI-76-A]
MAWAEWDQLKTEALDRRQGDATRMQLNQYPGDSGPGPVPTTPGSTGDLKANQQDLSRIGSHARTLYDRLWDQARLDNTSVDKAASDLASQGFALGSGLQHVSNRWSTQLNTVLDACAHISNHMQVTKKIHNGDEAYILRQMSSIATLDAGFDERVGPAGDQNPIYGEKK